jgi:prephenate dehydrogenase
LWADIFLANRVALGEALRDQAARLGEVERALAGGDREWLLRFIEGAAAGRERLRRAQAAPVEAPWRLVVGVPNRPGAISEIAMALGHAHINIEDLALRPGEDGAAGELSLLVSGEATAREAARLVASRGYAAEVAPAG